MNPTGTGCWPLPKNDEVSDEVPAACGRAGAAVCTRQTRAAQAVLSRIDGGAVFFSGEALYRGREMGTVEAALASGLETARTLLG